MRSTIKQTGYIASLLFQDSDYLEIQNMIPREKQDRDDRQLVLAKYLQPKLNISQAKIIIDQLQNEETEQIIGTFKHLLKDINKNGVFKGEHEMANYNGDYPLGHPMHPQAK